MGMRRELRVDVSTAAGTGEQLTVAATVLLPGGVAGRVNLGVNRRVVPGPLRLRLAFQIAAAVVRTASVTTPHRIRPAGPVTETAPIG